MILQTMKRPFGGKDEWFNLIPHVFSVQIYSTFEWTFVIYSIHILLTSLIEFDNEQCLILIRLETSQWEWRLQQIKAFLWYIWTKHMSHANSHSTLGLELLEILMYNSWEKKDTFEWEREKPISFCRMCNLDLFLLMRGKDVKLINKHFFAWIKLHTEIQQKQ